MDISWFIIGAGFGYLGGTCILNVLADTDDIIFKPDIIKISHKITSSEKTTMLGKVFLILILAIGYVMTFPALTLDLILLGLKNIINKTIKLTKPLFIRK